MSRRHTALLGGMSTPLKLNSTRFFLCLPGVEGWGPRGVRSYVREKPVCGSVECRESGLDFVSCMAPDYFGYLSRSGLLSTVTLLQRVSDGVWVWQIDMTDAHAQIHPNPHSALCPALSLFCQQLALLQVPGRMFYLD